MSFREKLPFSRKKNVDKTKVDEPITDAEDIARDYATLEAIKQVRQERRERRTASQSSGRSSKGSSISSQPDMLDRKSTTTRGSRSIKTNEDFEDETNGPARTPKQSTVAEDEMTLKTRERGSIKNRFDPGASEENLQISIREKYLSSDERASVTQKKRRRWSWSDIFSKRFINAIRYASRKVFRRRPTTESTDVNPDIPQDEEAAKVYLSSTQEKYKKDDTESESSEESQDEKPRKLGFFTRWRQKIKRKKKKKNEDIERPPKKKFKIFDFLKRKKKSEVELENKAELAGMT